MTFRQQILLDRLVAAPAAVVCNGLARLAGRILRRDHSIDPQKTRRILVAKLVGMGSIIQATPLLRALKQRFPHAQLTFLTLEGNRDLVERLEGVDEILCLDDRGMVRMMWTTLRALAGLLHRRVDHYFDLEIYSGFACLLALFSLARNRLGLYRHSNRFKRGIYTHLVYFNTRMPVRRIYLQLGRMAAISPDSEDCLGTIRINPADRAGLKRKLSEVGLKLEDRYILVNPNASDLLIERRWPEDHVLEALMLLTGQGHSVVLMGSPAEAEFVQSLCRRVPESARERVFSAAGRISLGEAFALIEGAACVLTNDTGPMHMAFALGRPTVCLMGPSHPVHYGLDKPEIVTLYAPVPCSPCVNEVDYPPCRGDNICMQRLSPNWVVSHVLNLLAQTEPAGVAPAMMNVATRLPLIWESELRQPLGIVSRCPEKS